MIHLKMNEIKMNEIKMNNEHFGVIDDRSDNNHEAIEGQTICVGLKL